MTTIILMKTNEAVYLAADSQVSAGNLKLRDCYDKITILGQTLMASCGSVALTQQLSQRCYKNCKINFVEAGVVKEPDIEDISKELSTLNFYLPLEYKNFQSASFLLAGMSEEGLRGYAVDDDGSKIAIETFSVSGSGGSTCLGLLDNFYKPDLELNQAAAILGNVILSASKSDIYTNGIIKVLAITNTGEFLEWSFKKEDFDAVKKDKTKTEKVQK